MNTSGAYKIRPAGRHILTIGRDLIQDNYAAVVELVKNAFDADSPDVSLNFLASEGSSEYSIMIIDHGHGMSRDTVINNWMVPSTDDKLKRRESPGGRIMQGRKGVGRYAASILGKDLLLETVTSQGEKTTVYVVWNTFEDAEYLDDVEILIETKDTSEPSGTQLTIAGNEDGISEWNGNQFRKLRFELKKLMPPISVVPPNDKNEDSFEIKLTVNGFPDEPDCVETIEPYPIFNLFDYKISGEINSEGKGVLYYSQQKVKNAADEIIKFDAGKPTNCGDLIFDIRVYDREKDAIDSLINRGLKDESGSYVGKLEARKLLNEYNGIGVYRNGFRIRPLGDADFDWLKLNEQRVQNPSLRIGSNQVIGYVQIQSEDLSGLVEKSARDGLRENEPFSNLKQITKEVISKLEERRFEYRQKAGLSRPAFKVERELERLFSFAEIKRDIRKKLTKEGISKKFSDEIIRIIDRDAEDKNKIAEEIRKTVAIYQGQATLGKIINVVLHEGRRPLNYFRNQIPNLKYWYDSYIESREIDKFDKCMSIIDGLSQNADSFVILFSRLDPLASGKRSRKKLVNLKKSVENTLSVFEEQLKVNKITTKVEGADDFCFSAWLQDIFAIFTNLIDNSIYWIVEKKSPKRLITIDIVKTKDSLVYIDYHDTGPGIDPTYIESGIIFEPHFSTKPDGTGLGLAIAGEAASRNGLELKAIESEQGAFFRIQPISGDQ